MQEPPQEAPRERPAEDGALSPGGGSRRAPRLVPLALAFYGSMLAVALIWKLLAGDSLLFASPEAERRGVRLLDVLLGASAGALVIGVSHQLTERVAWGRDLARALARVIGRLSVRDCLVLAAASGVAEEALFRGALQPRIGLVAASLLFGLAHFAPRRDFLPWTALSVAAGFLLGGLFELTGNLVAPVTAHALVNAVNLRLLTRRYAD